MLAAGGVGVYRRKIKKRSLSGDVTTLFPDTAGYLHITLAQAALERREIREKHGVRIYFRAISLRPRHNIG